MNYLFSLWIMALRCFIDTKHQFFQTFSAKRFSIWVATERRSFILSESQRASSSFHCNPHSLERPQCIASMASIFYRYFSWGLHFSTRKISNFFPSSKYDWGHGTELYYSDWNKKTESWPRYGLHGLHHSLAGLFWVPVRLVFMKFTK